MSFWEEMIIQNIMIVVYRLLFLCKFIDTLAKYTIEVRITLNSKS